MSGAGAITEDAFIQVRNYVKSIQRRLKWLAAAAAALIPWMAEQLISNAFVNAVTRLAGQRTVTTQLARLLRWAAEAPFQAVMGTAMLLLVAISLAAFIAVRRQPTGILPPATVRAATPLLSTSPVSPSAKHPVDPWPATGDVTLDLIHRELNALGGVRATDHELLRALRKLFYRSIFYHLQEERPPSALFVFCRARLLLQRYVGDFQSQQRNASIAGAITRIIKLQHHLEKLFDSPDSPFSAELHGERFAQNRDDFLAHLPSARAISDDEIKKGNLILKELEVFLKEAGLRD